MAVLQAFFCYMGLEKAIEHGKEHRKPFGKFSGNYTKSIDMSCRNHGGCPWCEGNRTYKYRRDLKAALEKMKEFANLYGFKPKV